MTTELKTITVLDAGGKMGMRISANFQKSAYQVFYCENSTRAGAGDCRRARAGGG